MDFAKNIMIRVRYAVCMDTGRDRVTAARRGGARLKASGGTGSGGQALRLRGERGGGD